MNAKAGQLGMPKAADEFLTGLLMFDGGCRCFRVLWSAGISTHPCLYLYISSLRFWEVPQNKFLRTFSLVES